MSKLARLQAVDPIATLPLARFYTKHVFSLQTTDTFIQPEAFWTKHFAQE